MRKPLTILLLSLPCALASLPAQSAPAAGLAGDFTASIGQAGNQLQLQLACRDDSHCMLTTVFSAPGAPAQPYRQQLDQVRLLQDSGEATAALQFAIRHQDDSALPPDLAEAMARLKPALAAKPAIRQCWDLNAPQAGYMLACSLSGIPAGAAPLYLFGSLQADGQQGFQRYVIYPLSRQQ
ncbi:hypothetical protein [Chromobacterium sphagni]|uniref:hypothetical protein n=1 Tax=Chromobacterium sphagni TaxID=1903179 RepID=UPI001113D8C8|nr:hypothetical protein [Chromobacterium sphagni]